MLDFTFKHENYVDLIFCQLKNLYIHNSVLILPQADQHNITEMSCMIPPLACSSMHRRQRIHFHISDVLANDCKQPEGSEAQPCAANGW